MDDAELSEVKRRAANARWLGQGARRAAETVIERAAELDDDQAEDVMRAVARPPFSLLIPARSQRWIADEDREERRVARAEARAREERAEAAHERALAAHVAATQARGDDVAVLDLVTGAGAPTVGAILERVRDETAARDEIAAAWAPDGRKPDEVMFEAAPAVRSKRLSAEGQAMARTMARFDSEHPDADPLDRALFEREARGALRRDAPRPERERARAEEIDRQVLGGWGYR
jgi:hypothetical protein